MLATFLSHQWMEFWRSRNKAGSLAGQLLLGFFMLYFLAVAVLLGFGMEFILEKAFSTTDTVGIFTSFILYYFLFEFAMRFQLQELPTLSIVPYLHLNIAKKKIVDFLNIKSLFSFFNAVPIFILVPFCSRKIVEMHGISAGIAMIVAVISLAFFSNFLVLYLKRKSISNILYFAAALGVITLLGVLDFYEVISIRNVSELLFSYVLKTPLLALIFPLLAFGMFRINAAYLYSNLYAEELGVKNKKKVSTDYAFLNSFGRVGELAALELKLILRHKRSRNTAMMGFFFLFYGFLFYKAPMIAKDEFGKMLFAAIFMTGIAILTYGQFMFAWQSTHFDGLLSNKINLRDFIKAKFLLFTISSTIITILSSFYGFMSWKLLAMHVAAYLYNIGFGTVIVLYFATLNYRRLDITTSASFNWQGVGASQFILSIPFIALPFLIYLPFGLLDLPYYGLLALGGVGLISLLMRGFWINWITNLLQEKKYRIAEGFRE